LVIWATRKLCMLSQDSPAKGPPHHALAADARLDGLPWTLDGRDRIRLPHVEHPGADPTQAERGARRGGVWRVPERRVWRLGARVPGAGLAGRVRGFDLVPGHRHRMADARRMGCVAPPLWQRDLAVHADVVVRVLAVRQRDRRVVSRGRA